MATAKKPVTKSAAKKAPAKKTVKPITTAPELAKLDAKAKREREKLLKTTDRERIKLMFEQLCFKATAHITAETPGAARASRWLFVYAESHTKLLEAQIDADTQPDMAEKAKAMRRVAARLKKFQELHNAILHFENWDAFKKQRDSAKTEKATKAAWAAMSEEEARAMAVHGIGDRQYRA